MVSIGRERSMTDCNHEEADIRIVVHVVQAIQDPNVSSVLVRTGHGRGCYPGEKVEPIQRYQSGCESVGCVWNGAQLFINQHQFHW